MRKSLRPWEPVTRDEEPFVTAENGNSTLTTVWLSGELGAHNVADGRLCVPFLFSWPWPLPSHGKYDEYLWVFMGEWRRGGKIVTSFTIGYACSCLCVLGLRRQSLFFFFHNSFVFFVLTLFLHDKFVTVVRAIDLWICRRKESKLPLLACSRNETLACPAGQFGCEGIRNMR